MTATAQDVIDTLKSIDDRLRLLNEHFGIGVRLEPKPDAVSAVASDRDLDSQHGNPEVKAKDPRDWTGPTMKGRRFSECPAAYLLLVADRLDYFAKVADELMREQVPGSDEAKAAASKARYNRLDASRARGWAERLRKGWTPPPEEPAAFTAPALTDDDIPFSFLIGAVLVGHAAMSVLC